VRVRQRAGDLRRSRDQQRGLLVHEDGAALLVGGGRVREGDGREGGDGRRVRVADDAVAIFAGRGRGRH